MKNDLQKEIRRLTRRLIKLHDTIEAIQRSINNPEKRQANKEYDKLMTKADKLAWQIQRLHGRDKITIKTRRQLLEEKV